VSPAIFNIFMNVFILELRKQKVGCYVCGMFLGCLLYADDIILLSPSVKGLQLMLDKCFIISCAVALQFNVNKSHCMVIGKMYKSNITPMRLGQSAIHWCSNIKYLGVHMLSGKSVKFDLNPVKRSFYSACNAIFSNCHGVTETVVLSLQESYSLSVLMYALPSLNVQRKQLDELNACWNSVIRRIFCYKRTESVKEVLHGLGRLNIKHLLLLRKVKFYKRVWIKKGLMHDIFNVYLLDNFMSDNCLLTVFVPSYVAVQNVHDKFSQYVYG